MCFSQYTSIIGVEGVFKILFYIHLFVCMPWQLCGDQRMTYRVDGSLLPPCEAQWLNSVPQMWQVPCGNVQNFHWACKVLGTVCILLLFVQCQVSEIHSKGKEGKMLLACSFCVDEIT